MAIDYALERDDKGPIGSFAAVQEVLRDLFPSVEFGWTTSGLEKMRLAEERGVTFPPELLKVLPNLPSLLEGFVDAGEYLVEFSLGHQEPVRCIYVTPRGDSPELDAKLAALEKRIGGAFVFSGQETNRAPETSSDL
jgi:hypothetical protein